MATQTKTPLQRRYEEENPAEFKKNIGAHKAAFELSRRAEAAERETQERQDREAREEAQRRQELERQRQAELERQARLEQQREQERQEREVQEQQDREAQEQETPEVTDEVEHEVADTVEEVERERETKEPSPADRFDAAVKAAEERDRERSQDRGMSL